jgi:hypothetical protein
MPDVHIIALSSLSSLTSQIHHYRIIVGMPTGIAPAGIKIRDSESKKVKAVTGREAM